MRTVMLQGQGHCWKVKVTAPRSKVKSTNEPDVAHLDYQREKIPHFKEAAYSNVPRSRSLNKGQ